MKSSLPVDVEMRGRGGPIDVVAITRREGFHIIQEKQMFGELQPTNIGFDRSYI